MTSNAERVLSSYKVLDAVSLAGDAASGEVDISRTDNASFHILCGAGATGEFFIQGSNKPSSGASEWVTIPVVDSTGAAITLAVTGTATNFLVNMQGLATTYIRVIYTRTSGTGTVNAYMTAKDL
jgi:hypothetical protein